MEALQVALRNTGVPNSHLTEQLEQLDAYGDGGRVLFARKAVREALCHRLEQACVTISEQHVKPSQARAALAFVKAVLRLTPVEPSEALAKQMLYGCGYFPAVAGVLNLINQQLEAENAALPRDLLNSAARAVVRAIDDACGYKFTSSPEGTTQAGLEMLSHVYPHSLVYGRVHLGPIVMQPLLDLMLLDTRHTSYSLRREAVSALLELCAMCRRNQQLLLKTHHALFDRLCGELLATCGDHATQLDIMEILYRCAKNDGADDIYSMFLDAETARQFKILLNKRGKSIDLGDELRALLVTYNGKKRSKASVVCLLAKGISLQHVPGVTEADQEAFCVDMGAGHFTISMLPVGPDGEGEDDGPLDLLDIDHDNILRVTVDQVERDGDHEKEEEADDLFTACVQLKGLPACLWGDQQSIDAGGEMERPLLVLLQFGLEAMQQFIGLIQKEMPKLTIRMPVQIDEVTQITSREYKAWVSDQTELLIPRSCKQQGGSGGSGVAALLNGAPAAGGVGWCAKLRDMFRGYVMGDAAAHVPNDEALSDDDLPDDLPAAIDQPVEELLEDIEPVAAKRGAKKPHSDLYSPFMGVAHDACGGRTKLSIPRKVQAQLNLPKQLTKTLESEEGAARWWDAGMLALYGSGADVALNFDPASYSAADIQASAAWIGLPPDYTPVKPYHNVKRASVVAPPPVTLASAVAHADKFVAGFALDASVYILKAGGRVGRLMVQFAQNNAPLLRMIHHHVHGAAGGVYLQHQEGVDFGTVRTGHHHDGSPRYLLSWTGRDCVPALKILARFSPTRSYPARKALAFIKTLDDGDDEAAQQLAEDVTAYNAAQPGLVRPLHEKHLAASLVDEDTLAGAFCADGSSHYTYVKSDDCTWLCLALQEGKNPAFLLAVKEFLGFGNFSNTHGAMLQFRSAEDVTVLARLLLGEAVQLPSGRRVAATAGARPRGAGKMAMIRFLLQEVQNHADSLPSSGPGSRGGLALPGKVESRTWKERALAAGEDVPDYEH